MGDPKRQHKRFMRPRQIFSKARIEEENSIIKNYGLKNMREIWKAETEINRIRKQAKELILEPGAQEAFFARLRKLGLIKGQVSIDDVLALSKEKLLERRLQTVVFKKGLAKTPKEARQLITHRKIKIGDRIVNIPSYIVKIEEEKNINVVKKEKIEKPRALEAPTSSTAEMSAPAQAISVEAS
ncbi:MAG: 30S ribosomal protein S4 [Candidatus Pacearchaeota archaeon]